MMHHLISLQQGRRMSAAISEEFLIDNLRGMTERQRIPLRQQIGTSQPKLTEAVVLMENNIEECLSPTELANYVQLSKRQLERLFKTYLDSTPMHYYLNLRLLNDFYYKQTKRLPKLQSLVALNLHHILVSPIRIYLIYHLEMKDA